MRKITCLLALALFLAACSKKNDDNPAPLTPATAKAADIIGTWKMMTDSVQTTTNGYTSVAAQIVRPADYYQFTDNTNGKYEFDNASWIFTYTLANGLITITIPHPDTGVAQTEQYTIEAISKDLLNIKRFYTGGYESIWFRR